MIGEVLGIPGLFRIDRTLDSRPKYAQNKHSATMAFNLFFTLLWVTLTQTHEHGEAQKAWSASVPFYKAQSTMIWLTIRAKFYIRIRTDFRYQNPV